MATTLAWSYPAVLEEHAGEIVVTFPDIPGAVTGANERDEALELAADALDVAVLHLLTRGEAVPDPRPAADGQVDILLNPVTAARVMFARAMASAGLDKVSAARRIDRDEKVVRRILDGRGAPVRFETVTEALKALGVRTTLAFEA